VYRALLFAALTLPYVTNGHDAAGNAINTTRIYEKQ
jgi:hypothetical protein